MKILILGSGGREHALVWRLSQDQSTTEVFIWPGNPGMTGKKLRFLTDSFNRSNFSRIVKDNQIDLVIPGAEKFLYEGVADWCSDLNLPCMGPSKNASQLEESKLFSL